METMGNIDFSDRPILHYVLAICITSVMVAFALSLRISLYQALMMVVFLLVTNIPIYSLAHYAGYRYRIKRNIFGVIF
jgi:membrane protein YdbS with pleckstrin-like domain